MDHAEVMTRIADAVAAPGGLATLVADPSPEAAAVREHVHGCADCTAEWRAWSVVSMGLASAAPDELVMRPAARDQILGSILSRPRPMPATAPVSVAQPSPLQAAGSMPTSTAPTSKAAPVPKAASGAPAARPAIVQGGRTERVAGMSSAASRAARRDEPSATQRGSWFKWVAVAAAAAVVLFVAGAAFGRIGSGGGEPLPTSGAQRVLVITAGILQGQGYNLAQLQTPDGAAAGFVAVSPGSGDLTVVSKALVPPPAGVKYKCVLVRDGSATTVGYMKFEGDLAYWAGPVTDPVDIGLTGDQFIVQLDTPGSAPALTGTF